MLRWWKARKMRWAVRWWAGLHEVDRIALRHSRRRAQELHIMAYHRRDLEAMRVFVADIASRADGG